MRLNETETDALTELANLAVSKAAHSLRGMVGSEVLLTVPAVALLSSNQAADLMQGASGGNLVAVKQMFDGDIQGCALVIFAEERSFELVKAVLAKDIPLDQIAELAPDALRETGNVILQSFLGTVANLLGRTFQVEVPLIANGHARELLKSEAPVLLIYVNFSIKGRQVNGYIALSLDVASQAAMKALLWEMIGRMTGEAPKA